MEYELMIRMKVRSPNAAQRVARQMESVFAFGTVKEAITEGLRLREEPQLLGVSACAASRMRSLETELQAPDPMAGG